MRRSAGILLYRRHASLEVLLVHPGGPYFAHKDVWGIPKGEYDESEEALVAAYREFEEETGHAVPPGEALALGEVTQKGGKRVVAWALEGDLDAAACVSNHFQIFWRGRLQSFPEVDEARWFSLAEARERIKSTQGLFLDRLVEQLG